MFTPLSPFFCPLFPNLGPRALFPSNREGQQTPLPIPFPPSPFPFTPYPLTPYSFLHNRSRTPFLNLIPLGGQFNILNFFIQHVSNDKSTLGKPCSRHMHALRTYFLYNAFACAIFRPIVNIITPTWHGRQTVTCWFGG